MFINGARPRVIWHGPDTFTVTIRDDNDPLWCQQFLAMSSSRNDAWSTGMKPRTQRPSFEDAEYEARDQDYTMEDAYISDENVPLHPCLQNAHTGANEMIPTHGLPVPGHPYTHSHTWQAMPATISFPIVDQVPWKPAPNNMHGYLGPESDILPKAEGHAPFFSHPGSDSGTAPLGDALWPVGAPEMMSTLTLGDSFSQQGPWSLQGSPDSYATSGFCAQPTLGAIATVQTDPSQPAQPLTEPTGLLVQTPPSDPVEPQHTVSPKFLQINPSPPLHRSSFESDHTSYLTAAVVSDASDTESQNPFTPSSSRAPTPLSQRKRATQAGTQRPFKPRRQLPGKLTSGRLVLAHPAAGSSNEPASAAGAGPLSAGSKPTECVASKKASEPTMSSDHTRPASSTRRPPTHPVLPPATAAAKTPRPSRQREVVQRNDFLIRCRREGLTYREIRRKGGFTEAESTLRGRYRALTKPRDARLRKPEWTGEDLRLLDQGVRMLARGRDLRRSKIPWKKVAEYIVENGGKYLFGNTTCRKRWDELVAQQASRGQDIGKPFFD